MAEATSEKCHSSVKRQPNTSVSLLCHLETGNWW